MPPKRKEKKKAPAAAANKQRQLVASRPTSTKNVVSIPSGMNSSRVGSLAKYLCAINDPFCLAAEGARIPDEYSMPTEAVTCRMKVTWTPNDSANETLVFVPDPRFSMAAFVGTGTTAPTVNCTGAGAVTTSQIGIVASRLSSLTWGQAVSAFTLEQRSTKFRVVGWGVRVRNITQAINVAGDLTVALTPTGSYLAATFGIGFGLANVAEPNPWPAWNEPQESFGVPYSSNNGSSGSNGGHPKITSLETLPVSEVFAAAELAQSGGILIKPRINSPEAFSWRSPQAIGNNFGLAFTTAASTGGSATGMQAACPSVLSLGGQNCVVVQSSVGLTAQTYEFEVVYHLEIQPNTLVGAALGHSASASPVVTRSSLDSILSRVNASPFVEFIKHEGSRAIGSMVQGLPGLMTKAAMMALAV